MAIRDIWESKHTVVTIYAGHVTGQELLEASLEKSGDDRFDDIKYIIADWREADRVEISPNDVKALVACLRSIARQLPHAKNATVLNRDETGSALVAWYKFLAEDLPWDIGIFYNMEEARQWCSG